VDVKRRDDRFLDELARLYARQRSTLLQLDLWHSTYPELQPFYDDIRECLVTDDPHAAV